MKDLKTLLTMLAQLSCILTKRQKKIMILMFLVILLGSAFELLGVTAMLPFIQAIMAPEVLINKPYIKFFTNLVGVTDESSVIVIVGIGIILIYILKNIYLAFSSYFQAKLSNDILRELSVTMLKSYMNRPYSFFVDSTSGEVMRGVSGDTSGVYSVIQNGFKLLSEGLVIILLAVYLVTTDYVLALGVLVSGICCLFVIVLGLKKVLSKLSILFRKSLSKQNQWVVQSIGGIKDIMVFDRRNHFLDGYNAAYEDSNKANVNYVFAGALPERIIEAVCITGIIITVLLRLNSGVNPAEFVPQLSVFAMAAFRLLPSISRSIGYINAFVYYRLSVEATYENILKARKHIESINELVSEEDKKNAEFERIIEVKGIDWKYPQGKENILEEFDLEIKKGESIGIIGGSGSGKSTLADIMLRLYLPQKGEICMDGTNINSIPQTWSKNISYVPQAVFLMDDTIRANIAFGDENIEDEKIWKALEQASLSEFVKGLPGGLDTIVGERGVKFSGGQRQRIAIARALYNQPQILILDEATSALDNETEEAVMEAIDSLAGSMTLIIIAHRVTTLKSCDKIYEIIDGKAIERKKEDVIHV